MKKYISVLLISAIAGTVMAQQTFQPKHPGILARQLGVGQKKEVRLTLPQNQNANKLSAATRAAEPEQLQLDSVVVSDLGALKTVQYYEYHPNGNMAKLVTMGLDRDGNKKEISRTEWTDNYSQKGSSMTEFGYDTLGVYGPIYKIELHDDNGYSYCEYNGTTGQLKPVERLSTTLNERYQKLTEAYYYYDVDGNEQPEDSIVYTYDNDNRLVRETYFLADENGKMEELGYFETSYEDVETPLGPGTLARLQDSDNIFRQDSIFSNDFKYLYYAFYSNDDETEWVKHEERASYDYGDTMLELRFKYKDNAVYSGYKLEAEYKDEESERSIIAHEYSCGADTTQWVLVRRLEDYFSTSESEYGREDSNNQSYIYEADENGVINPEEEFAVLIYKTSDWYDSYTRLDSEYYFGEEETGKYTTYYYHNPNATGITAIKVQTEDGMQFDLEGRQINTIQRGTFMIKNGRVILNR